MLQTSFSPQENEVKDEKTESSSYGVAEKCSVELAPMVRVGALGFRELCSLYGADVVFSEEVVGAKLAGCLREVVRYPQVSSPVIEFVSFERWKNKWKRVVVFSTLSRNSADINELAILPPESGFCTGRASLIHPPSAPVILQLGVADPEIAKRAVQVLQRGDVQGIDLNMGCPKAFSVRNGFGAALMQKTAVAGAILRAIYDVVGGVQNDSQICKGNIATANSEQKENSNEGGAKSEIVRISFKTRLCATPLKTYEMLREVLLSAGHSPENGAIVVHQITLHARFVEQRSETPAHYGIAKEVVDLCRQDPLFRLIRFCLNGSLLSRVHAQKMCRAYGFDDAMLGRSALQNPAVFSPLFPIVISSQNRSPLPSGLGQEEENNKCVPSSGRLLEILLEMWEYAVRYQTSFANFKYHMQRIIPEVPALKHLMPQVQCETRQYFDFLPIFVSERNKDRNSISTTRYSELCTLERACRAEPVLLDECPAKMLSARNDEEISGRKRKRHDDH